MGDRRGVCVGGGCWSVLAWEGLHHASQPMRAFGGGPKHDAVGTDKSRNSYIFTFNLFQMAELMELLFICVTL